MQHMCLKRQVIGSKTRGKRYEKRYEKTMEKLMQLCEITIHKIMKYIIMIGKEYVGKMES